MVLALGGCGQITGRKKGFGRGRGILLGKPLINGRGKEDITV